MSTVTRTRKSLKTGGRKADLVVSLALSINHTVYTVEPIRSEDPDIIRAWRLSKRGADGAVYDVALTVHGYSCDCPDFIGRRDGIDPAGCKHCRALTTAGLLDAPAAIAPPAVAEVDPFARVEAEDNLDPAAAFPPSCCSAGEPAACPPCQSATAADDAPATAPEPDSTDDDVDQAEVDDPDDTGEFDPILDDDPSATWELGPDPAGPQPTAEDLAEAMEMFGAMDAARHLDRSDRLTFDQLIERQIEFYESWKNDAGRMFAQHMTELLMRARWVSATTPQEYDARAQIAEQDAQETHWKAGYAEGRQHGLAASCPHCCGSLD
jgi:hypothetical protein